MRRSEPFNGGKAQRLCSITCDRCGEELWAVAGQPMGVVGWGRNWPDCKHDLCVDCLDGLRHTLDAYMRSA